MGQHLSCVLLHVAVHVIVCHCVWQYMSLRIMMSVHACMYACGEARVTGCAEWVCDHALNCGGMAECAW